MDSSVANSMHLGVIQSAMDAIITVDEAQHIVLFNLAAESIFRCSAAEAMGASINRFIPERFRAAHRQHIDRFGTTGTTMRRMGRQTIISGLRADGDEFPIEASISQATVDGKKLYTVILRDITERERAATELEQSNQQLRQLYEGMHEVREGERTRIARELHDELAQSLTALKMDAAWVLSRLPAEETQLSTRIQRMKDVIDTTVAAVRRIASDLRPVMLDDLGLVAAVEHLLHTFSGRTGIAVNVEARTGDVELREPHATAIYRMVQEALTNVARHAGASAVDVEIVVAGPSLRVRVRDNGEGIRPEALQTQKSYGLLGIRERAQTLGGAARIFAPPDGGTVVEILIPVEEQSEQENPR